MQLEKGDSLTEGYTSELWDFTYISVTQNNEVNQKKVDVFSLSIYRLMIFPRALGYIDEAVTNLFDRLDRGLRLGPFTWDLGSYWLCVVAGTKIVRSRQFVPAFQGLAQCEFSYKDNSYKKKIREMTNAW
ncbi:hypothetical protein Gotur_033757, partial [Gossypium turneri]